MDRDTKFGEAFRGILEESGIKAVCLLAISDQGKPSYNANLAEKLAKMGMPCFGCVPDKLPDLLAAVLKGQDLHKFAENATVQRTHR